MMQDANAEHTPITDRYETAADEMIAICGGDLRAAVKALIVANEFLEEELEMARIAVSRGYSRGRYGRKTDQETHS